MSGQNGTGQTAQAAAVQQEKAPEVRGISVVSWDPQNATEAWNLAMYYGKSNLIPDTLKNVADVFVTIAAGRDFGWSPMQSMRGIYVVKGKPALSADAMVGIAKKSPVCEYFRLVFTDATKATYETKRKGDPEPVRMTFTIEEAKQAGLIDKAGSLYLVYPARMLRNRCKSALCKEVYEELFFGVYEVSEAEEIEVNQAPRQRIPMTEAPTDIDEPRKTAQEQAAQSEGTGPVVDVTPAAQEPAKPAEVVRTQEETRVLEFVSAADDIVAFKAALDGIGMLKKDQQTEPRLALIRQIDLHLGKANNKPTNELGKVLFRTVSGLPDDQKELGQKVYNRHSWLKGA